MLCRYTRAMKKLYLSYTETRRLYGQEVYQRPSRFLEEVPEKYLDSILWGTLPIRMLNILQQNTPRANKYLIIQIVV